MVRDGLLALGVVSIGLAAPPAFGSTPCPSDSPQRIAASIALLDSPLPPGDAEALGRRMATLDDPILRCPGPNPAPALLRVFLRSRYGAPGEGDGPWSSLPEDPDLFERALVALQGLPPEQVVDGASEGLGKGLRTLTWRRLRHDWLEPASQGLRVDDRRWLAEWRPPPGVSDSAEELVALVEREPQAALFALTTGGGSLAHEVVRPLQDQILAALLIDARRRPALLRAVLGVVVDSGLGGPAVLASLDDTTAPDAPTRAATDRVRTHLGQPVAWRPVSLPTTPPGRLPGHEATDQPSLAITDVVTRHHAGLHLSFAWQKTLLGLFLAAGALALGVGGRPRRKWAGPAFGLGVLLFADGIVDGCQVAPPAAGHPLFQFIAQSEVRLEPTAHGHVTSGGSIRFQHISDQKTPGVPRVAFLGASSVHGSHYVAEHAFPARVTAHGRPIEALNFGIGGTTSAGVAAAGRVALDLGADALVVMYGHNEAAQFTRLALYSHTRPAAMRLRFVLAQSGLYRLFSSALAPARAASAPADLYRTDAPTRAEVADLTRLATDHLRRQLGGLFAEANRADVPVVLVLPPTNLRFAHLQPFETPGPGDAADLDDLRRRADEAAARGDASTARELLQLAIDRSASPREVVTPVRNTLVALGRTHGLVTVDAGAWMYAHAPDGVTPSGLFWDDVHPTAEGHEVLAKLLATVLDDVLQDTP